MINTELMQETLDYIAAHPDEHDQGDWGEKTDCGTTRCMAGTAIHVTLGCKMLFSESDDGWGVAYSAQDAQGRHRYISELAQELLGVDDEQAEDLFYEACTLEDLYAYAEKFTGIDMRILASV